jgi:hypothetical protein
MAILNRPGQAMAAGDSAWGKATGVSGAAGPSGMFGMNSYFEGIGDYNTNAINANRIGTFNAKASLVGNMIGAAADVAGSYGQGRMSQGKSFFPGMNA